MAFRTEAELETHVAIEHKVKSAVTGGSKAGGAITANALLAFDTSKDDEDDYGGGRGGSRGGRGRGRGGRGGKQDHHEKQFEIKDQEGVNFKFYFSEKY